MFRKTLSAFLVLMVVGGLAMATDLQELQPVKFYNTSRGPVVNNELDDWSELFVISRWSDDASEYYLGSGTAGDTMCVVFQPLASCSIYVGQTQFYGAGAYQAFVWDYSDEAEAEFPSGRSPNRGSTPISPLGDVLFGPYANEAEASQDWETMFSPDDLPGGGIAWDDSKFVVGFVKTQDDGLPQPLANDEDARDFTYTWFGGPWMAEDYDYIWGSYSSDITEGVDIMMRVLVAYTSNPPPIISSMTQLPNTINFNKDCTVKSDIYDDNGWTTDTATLMVKFAGGDPVSFAMSDDDEDGVFDASFNLGNYTLAVGDMISYWIETEDDEGVTNSNEDNQLNFLMVALEHPADASILVIDDGMGDRADVLYEYLDMSDYVFEYWDVGANKGLDGFTLDAGSWNTIFLAGWGVGTLPTREWAGSIFANSINANKNFILNDMDYFFINGEEDLPTFAAGDLAYDVFGIESGANDPQPTDTSFYGETDDVISGDWAEEPYIMDPAWSGNWADFVVPTDDAVPFFTGAVEGNIMAIRKEAGEQRNAYFSFDIFSNCWEDSFLPYPDDYPDYWVTYLRPTEECSNLMDNLLAWVNPEVTVEEGGSAVLPEKFSLSQNYPNPFNPTTTISFNVPSAQNVSLKVFNVAGQEVATLHDGHMTQGSKSLTFDASELASGIYFYRFEAGSFTASRKMVLLK